MSKKVFRSVVAVALVCVMICTLAACTTTLKGTYTMKEGLVEQSFTFLEDNRVKMSAFGIEIEGEYEIDGDEITITYGLFGLSYDWVKSFKKEGGSIFIDGVEFVKEK